MEAYGAPPISLAGFQNVDIPCGEGFNWKVFTWSRWASSGGRLAGKRMIADEGWTWLGYPNRFGDSLEGLKVASDLQFLCGINETYGVSYGYSPVRFGAPGGPPYFGPIVNHTQPYWPYFSHLADYIARTQSLLQQGRPVTDVAVYLAEEDCFATADVDQLVFRFTRQFGSGDGNRNHRLWSATEHGAPAITTIATNGYSFDGVDWSIFGAGLRAVHGRLKLGDGDYGILLMPKVEGLDPRVIDTLLEFVNSGGTLIATRRLPDKAYGLGDRAEGTKGVVDAITKLFGSGRLHDHLHTSQFGRGKAIFCPDDDASLLAALGATCPADIQFARPSRYVGFQHRATSGLDIYFIANTSAELYESPVRFRST